MFIFDTFLVNFYDYFYPNLESQNFNSRYKKRFDIEMDKIQEENDALIEQKAFH